MRKAAQKSKQLTNATTAYGRFKVWARGRSNSKSVASAFIMASMARLIGGSWTFGVIVVVSVLVHELGHYVAARFLAANLTNVRISLSPLYGWTGFKGKFSSERELFVIVIAGPAAGTLFAALVWFYDALTPGLSQHRAIFAIALLNFINLLPTGRSDGGHLRRSLFNTIHSVWHMVSLVAFVVFTFWLAINYPVLFGVLLGSVLVEAGLELIGQWRANKGQKGKMSAVDDIQAVLERSGSRYKLSDTAYELRRDKIKSENRKEAPMTKHEKGFALTSWFALLGSCAFIMLAMPPWLS